MTGIVVVIMLPSFDIHVLQPCFPGLISSEDRVDCRLCPAGFSCDPDDGTLFFCPPGQHSPEGVPQCLTCPVDSVCNSGFPHKVTMAADFPKKVLYLVKKYSKPCAFSPCSHVLIIDLSYCLLVWAWQRAQHRSHCV